MKIKDINSRWEILNGNVNETLKNVLCDFVIAKDKRES